MNHVINIGTDLNERKITCSIPNTTEITELKYIAKVNDDKYIAENKMTVEGQTGECSVGYYHYNDTINIFYLRNSSGVVTNLSNFTLPDDFGTVTEIDDTAVLYDYLTRDCHEKVYVICEDFCKEESLSKSQIKTEIEEQAKNYGVPNGSIFNFDGDTIPGGFEEVKDPLIFENTDAVLTNVVSRNIFDGIVEKGAFNDSGNKIEDTTQLRNSFMIEVKSNTKYIASNSNSGLTLNFFEYDSSKKFIKKTTISSGDSLTTSLTTKYINFCRTSFNLNKMQIEKGTTITSYIPHLNLQELQKNTEYSSEEQVIGIYYEKPLYRKQISISNFPANQLKQVAHNISNLENIIKIDGNVRLDYDNPTTPAECRKVPLYWLKTNFDIDFSISKTTLNFNSTHSTVVNVSAILILEYTKTTN